ncbi:MAG: FAD-dependent oxidoreductase [Kiritimatiellia bacterium]
MKIIVVGGVAAGASAAARARRLDETAEIIILEQGRHVSFANCGLPYHIGGDIRDREHLLLQTPQSLKASLNLDVRTAHRVQSIDRAAKKITVRDRDADQVYEETYDKLVLCPGASPIRPPLPGIDLPKVFVLRNVVDMDIIKREVDQSAKHAVVIGGGYIGVEMAENLRHRKMDVELIELARQIIPPLDPEMARDLEDHMRQQGVKLHLGVAASAFRKEGERLVVELANGKKITTDFVVLSVGVRPEAGLAKDAGLELGPNGGIKVDEHMRTSDPDIYAAGDAVEIMDTVTGKPSLIPLAGPANRQGRIAAENICGRNTKYTTTQGTSVVKVFHMTGGGTGATEKMLKRQGIKYNKAYIHPPGHAEYYPGTAAMHLKLLFADDGKILGAQVVGFDGIDKRIDVLATALRAGLTVYDLQELELAYAPPYGSAKDPVNMIGFVASNMLQGDTEVWYAEDFPAKTQGGTIVDVRPKTTFDLGHIPGAVNIPLGQLRERMDEIPRDKPVYLYCKVGFTSYLAYRILKQKGYSKAANLSGGMLTFKSWHGDEKAAGGPEAPLVSYPTDTAAEPVATGKTVELDACGLQCPGPIMKLKDTVAGMNAGDELVVVASDPGFASDAPAWCRRNGHELIEVQRDGMNIRARIRVGGAPKPVAATSSASSKKTFVVFSGELDRVLAAFIIANGAVAMGSEVTLFFTFWGLNALRKGNPPPVEKGPLDKMFGMMMPRGAEKLKLSNLNMMGAGTKMMQQVMKSKGVKSLPELMADAKAAGVRLVACSMSMDVMGIRKEELIDGVEVGGVAAFLEEADQSGTTMFI